MGFTFDPLVFSGLVPSGTSGGPSGDAHWKAPVANQAALPAVGNNQGDIRVTLDTGYIWEWNGSAWVLAAIPYAEKGANNGVATLDSVGHVPLSQLPASVVEYKGTWDASTNTPPLADGTGVSGYFYIVSVGGTQNLGSGAITFFAGDWVLYNGTVWERASNFTGYANATLSNLASPTNINQDLLPNGSVKLGDPTHKWTQLHVSQIFSDNSTLSINLNTGGNLSVFGGDTDFNNTRLHNLLDPTSAQDAATKNYVDTAGGAFANKTLSNLTNPTSINQNLIPASAGVEVLGTTAKYWGPSFINQINDTSNQLSADFFNRTLADHNGNPKVDWENQQLTDQTGNGSLRWTGRRLVDTSGSVNSLDWNTRTLIDSASQTQLAWSTSGISISGPLNMNTHQIHNVTDPTSAQDAATKNYVDTAGTAFANKTLSNLTSPTNINQDLLPNGSVKLGDPSNKWTQLHVSQIFSDNSTLSINLNTGGNLSIFGGDTDFNNTRAHNLLNPTSAQDAATKSYVDTGDALAANKSLSNLTSPTSINQNLIPQAGINLGSASFPFNDARVTTIEAAQTATDDVAVTGTFTATTHTTVDGSNNTTALQMTSTAIVDVGATNDKADGVVATVARGDGTDDGTLQEMTGLTAIMQHNSGTGGVTTDSVGFDVALITQQGTITNQYDFRSQRIPVGGNLTNHYGIYLNDDSTTPVKNWVSGRTQMGGSTFSPANSTLLDLQSTTGALLVPRMSTTQKTALTAAEGMIVYDTTDAAIEGYMGGTWTSLGGGGGGGANQHLSNLLSPTAVNQALSPDAGGTRDMGTVTEFWNNCYLNQLWDSQGSGTMSIDVNNRRLAHSTSGNTTVDWDSMRLTDNTNLLAADWSTRSLVDAGGTFISIDWANRELDDAGANTALTWNNRRLIDSTGAISAKWEDRQLLDTTSVVAVDYANRELLDASGNLIVNWNAQHLLDSSTTVALNWFLRNLVDSSGTKTSVDWDNRQLFANDGTTVNLDWHLPGQVAIPASRVDPVVVVTGNTYNINAQGDYHIVLNDTTAEPATITFPAGVEGLHFFIGFASTNLATWTPAPSGGDTIDANISGNMASNVTVPVVFSGGVWYEA